MLAWFYELPPRGSFKILESTNPLNTNMYALCWADKKPKRIIVSRGTPLPGSDSVRGRRERPEMVELFYSNFSAVDVHNHYRHGSLRLEVS
ncbi:hypothetical protein GQ600_7153 [Phytophthora cactorum]|nr:hypothetical protein GQ600_7153 [Phytophthora cactorum]